LARAFGILLSEDPVTAGPKGPQGEDRAFGLHVLLAEDNPVNQQVAMEMLQGLGCTVVLAQDGSQAVEWGTRDRFDLILMDCLMPNLDGFAATRAIRRWEATSAGPRQPVIALTALAMEGDRERCLAAGMDDFLAKPFRRRQMVQVLARWQSRLRASTEGTA
jgi:CheY-like chemotaxis protein